MIVFFYGTVQASATCPLEPNFPGTIERLAPQAGETLSCLSNGEVNATTTFPSVTRAMQLEIPVTGDGVECTCNGEVAASTTIIS